MIDLQHVVIPVDDFVKLVQLQPEQAPRLFELTNNNREYLGKFLPWVPYVKSVGDSKKHIKETLENRAKNITYTYGIEYYGEIIGDISLRNIDEPSKTEIGYWMDESYSGKGITTNAVKALTTFGFNLLNLKEIMIRAVPDNLASNKVAEKAGYTFIGKAKDDAYKELNVWSITNHKLTAT